MPFERKRAFFILFTLVVLVTGLLMRTSLWFIPISARYHYEKIYNSPENINESFKSFNEYLESVKYVIMSSLQNIEKSSADYLIYDCSSHMSESCGGWNDRITGVINTLMISLVINKRYRLIIDKPCDIQDYFLPNKINWTVDPNIMSTKNMSKTNRVNGGIMHLDVSRHFRSSVNLFRNNWDAVDMFRVTQSIRDKIPWICNVHHADIYKLAFEVLFKPTDSVLRPIAELHLNNSRKLVCAHVRIGYIYRGNKVIKPLENRFPIKNIGMVFDFLQKYDPATHNVYIATDTPKVKELARKKFHKNFIDIRGKITHFELDRGKDVCDGYAKSLREWWILTKCDVLVLTQSGFGMMAAYLRDNNKPLYCTDGEKLFPCSRYEILEHYPMEMHIPKYIPISRRHNETHNYCPTGELQITKNIPWYLLPLIK